MYVLVEKQFKKKKGAPQHYKYKLPLAGHILVIYFGWGGVLIVNWKGQCNFSVAYTFEFFLQFPWVDAGVVTEEFSEHKLFAHEIQGEENIASVDVDWWEKECFNCSVTVETRVANQIQTFGHDNYSRQMCLLVV